MIGDSEPLAWILAAERVAFSRSRSHLAEGNPIVSLRDSRLLSQPNPGPGSTLSARPGLPGWVEGAAGACQWEKKHSGSGATCRSQAWPACEAPGGLRDVIGRLRRFPDPQAWSAQLRISLSPARRARRRDQLHSELHLSFMKALPLDGAGYLQRSRFKSEATKHLAKLHSW